VSGELKNLLGEVHSYHQLHDTYMTS